MRKILAIAWNDIYIELSDRWTLLFFLILPIVFTTILGLALGSFNSSSDSRLRLPVVDEDSSVMAAELKTYLSGSNVFRADFMSAADAEALFNKRSVAAVLTIPANFTKNLYDSKQVSLVMKEQAENANTPALEQAVQACANQLNAAVAAALQSTNAASQVRSFSSVNSRQNYWQRSLDAANALLKDPPVEVIISHSSVSASIIPSGFGLSSPGQLVTWVLITLLGASEVFVNERLGGTLRRLVITPTRRAVVITGKIVGRLGLGLLQMLLLVGFGALVLGVKWGRDPAALALLLFCFGLMGTSLGVMLGTLARTRAQSSSLTVLFSMLLGALGGAWWPLEITPALYQNIVKIFPSTWAMSGLTDVIVRGKGLVDILPTAGVLLAFAVVFFGVGVWRLRYD